MSIIKIKEGIYSVGVLNPNMRIFDVIMRTEFGTSYNAYLITGKKNILIDTVHAEFFDEYLENIRSIVDPSKIDYVIMNHNEPDHSGSLAKLLEVAPQIKVLSSPGGKIYLDHITNRSALNVTSVKDGETLDIGDGKSLKFIHAPLLHWPDTMFTWMESDKIAFTCDFLGCHYCEPRMFDNHISYPTFFERAFREYFDSIFSPFKSYVQKGLSKLNALDADYVCTSHGPILTKGVFLEMAKVRYDEWSRPFTGTSTKQIPIFYCSAYGNTALLAREISKGINSVRKDLHVDLYDINEYDDMRFLQEKMNESDAFLLGSPTINKDAVSPVWSMACAIDAINCKGKPVSAFGSFGWSGEAVPGLIARLKSLKMNVFEEGFTCRFVPSKEELSNAFEFGARFAAGF
jgi:flavorubredoxin